MPITHAIFDLDGTLLDTEDLYTRAAQAVVGQFDKQFTANLKRQTMGGSARHSAATVIDALELPLDVDDYLAQRDAVLFSLLPDVTPMRGAERLVRALRSRGLSLAIATSSNRNLFEAKSQKQQFVREIEVVVCGDDPRLKEPKPAPDIFLLAAGDLGAQAVNCLAFEDSANGVRAAVAAGMHVTALADPRYGLSELAFPGAARTVSSLEQLDVAALLAAGL